MIGGLTILILQPLQVKFEKLLSGCKNKETHKVAPNWIYLEQLLFPVLVGGQVAGMKLEPEKIVTKISTHTFEEQSYQQFLDSLKEDNYVLIESSTNVPCEFCLP